MNKLEAAAWKVVLAWKSRKYLKDHIEELEQVLVYIAKDKKVK